MMFNIKIPINRERAAEVRDGPLGGIVTCLLLSLPVLSGRWITSLPPAS